MANLLVSQLFRHVFPDRHFRQDSMAHAIETLQYYVAIQQVHSDYTHSRPNDLFSFKPFGLLHSSEPVSKMARLPYEKLTAQTRYSGQTLENDMMIAITLLLENRLTRKKAIYFAISVNFCDFRQ